MQKTSERLFGKSMIILKENLVDALKIAIYYKQLYEQTVLKYTGDSAQAGKKY
jgi:hypothetical protein